MFQLYFPKIQIPILTKTNVICHQFIQSSLLSSYRYIQVDMEAIMKSLGKLSICFCISKICLSFLLFKLKAVQSGILKHISGNLSGHEDFNLHSLLDNPHTSGEYSKFNINYDVYNGVPINIEIGKSLQNIVHSSSTKQKTEINDTKIKNDPTTNPNLSVNSSDSLELNHKQENSKDRIVAYILKACFGNDRSANSKIQRQLQTMFGDSSGLFQINSFTSNKFS